uniref:Uncharacterized protein n=1 Tax=Salix viminalis TaxID=40686 RepID=A0A6N2N025_SALVM
MATLISSCSDDHAATDVLEVHVLSRDDQENLHTSHVGSEKKLSSHNIWSSRGKPKVVLQLQTIRSREKNRGAAIEWENQMLNGRIRIVLRIDQSQILFSLVQKQQKKSLPRQGELLIKYTSAEVLEKEGLIIGVHDFVGDGKRRWTMVSDTASLVGKESRKSLKLLQGLKRTRMVIPKMGR